MRYSTHQHQTAETERRHAVGFSLVEVTLAMLVVALGILAVFALFPFGLDQSRQASSETRAALLAEEVFSGLRAQADTDWDSVGVALPVAGADLWDNYVALQTGTTDVSNVTAQVYSRADAPAIVDHALRYALVVSNQTATRKSALLSVWDGRFGSLKYPTVFYTEVTKRSP